MSNECPKCGRNWNEHEFAVPAPYCPTASELPSSTHTRRVTERQSSATRHTMTDDCSKTVGAGFGAANGSTAHGSWYDVFYTDAAGEIQVGECYALTLADAKLITPLMYPRVQEIEYKPESVR